MKLRTKWLWWRTNEKGEEYIYRTAQKKSEWRGSTFNEFDRIEEAYVLTRAELERLVEGAWEGGGDYGSWERVQAESDGYFHDREPISMEKFLKEVLDER